MTKAQAVAHESHGPNWLDVSSSLNLASTTYSDGVGALWLLIDEDDQWQADVCHAELLEFFGSSMATAKDHLGTTTITKSKTATATIQGVTVLRWSKGSPSDLWSSNFWVDLGSPPRLRLALACEAPSAGAWSGSWRRCGGSWRSAPWREVGGERRRMKRRSW